MKNKYIEYFEGNLGISPDNEGKLIHINRGLLFGETVFTSIRVRNSTPMFLTQHLRRLQKGCSFLYRRVNFNWEEFESQIKQAIAKIEHKYTKEGIVDWYLRITFFLDSHDDSFFTRDGILKFFILAKPLGAFMEESKAVSVCIASNKKVLTTFPSYLKIGSYIDSFLELSIALEKGFDDVLFLSIDGKITECTTSNIFFRKNDIIYTPTLNSCVLDGITRSKLIDCLEKNKVKVIQSDWDLDDILIAQDVWLTNSIKGVRPVKRIGEKEYCTQGSWTQKITDIFLEYCEDPEGV